MKSIEKSTSFIRLSIESIGELCSNDVMNSTNIFIVVFIRWTGLLKSFSVSSFFTTSSYFDLISNIRATILLRIISRVSLSVATNIFHQQWVSDKKWYIYSVQEAFLFEILFLLLVFFARSWAQASQEYDRDCHEIPDHLLDFSHELRSEEAVTHRHRLIQITTIERMRRDKL